MLYKVLLKLKERNGLTLELMQKICVFYATGRLSETEYNNLLGTVSAAEEVPEQDSSEGETL